MLLYVLSAQQINVFALKMIHYVIQNAALQLHVAKSNSQ